VPGVGPVVSPPTMKMGFTGKPIPMETSNGYGGTLTSQTP
jgi:hypothetical protein